MSNRDGRNGWDDATQTPIHHGDRRGLARSFNLYTTVVLLRYTNKGSEAHLIFSCSIHSCRSCLHMALHTTGRLAPTTYIHLASGFRLAPTTLPYLASNRHTTTARTFSTISWRVVPDHMHALSALIYMRLTMMNTSSRRK
jgi:hypothetical protein